MTFERTPLSDSLGGLLVMLCGILWSAMAAAQQLPPSSVAIIEMKQIWERSAVGLALSAQADRYGEEQVAWLSQTEKAAQDERRELDRQRAILSAEVFAEKRQAFQRRISETRRQFAVREQALKQAFDTARRTVIKEIITIVADLSRTKGFNIVLRKTKVEYFTPAPLEITDDVIAILDQRLPELKVPRPATE